jgi:soluble P-type ATPase
MDIMIANGNEDWLREFVSKKLAEKMAANVPPEQLALVIDGGTLIHALETDAKKVCVHSCDGAPHRKTPRQDFLQLALMCRSVVCCRVSPLQKAKVVLLVKESTPSRTLAIGDGANDVSMIQAAAIGVGIQGEEGGQAARAADYSIGQFRFLQQLLFVHGNWNYFRQARLIFYQFYIQIVYNTVQFYYSTVAAWSETFIFQQLLATLFYTLFTGVDVVFPTILDRIIPVPPPPLLPPISFLSPAGGLPDLLARQSKKALIYPEAYASNVKRPMVGSAGARNERGGGGAGARPLSRRQCGSMTRVLPPDEHRQLLGALDDGPSARDRTSVARPAALRPPAL